MTGVAEMQATTTRLVPRRRSLPWLRNCLLASLLLSLSGCASYSPQPLQNWPAPGNIQTQTERGVTVAAGILEDEQARQLYGVDLASAGLQAIWLRIENATEHGRWLMVSALDPNYFAPNEAAVLFYPDPCLEKTRSGSPSVCATWRSP